MQHYMIRGFLWLNDFKKSINIYININGSMKATRTKTIIPFRLWIGAGMTPVIEHTETKMKPWQQPLI